MEDRYETANVSTKTTPRSISLEVRARLRRLAERRLSCESAAPCERPAVVIRGGRGLCRIHAFENRLDKTIAGQKRTADAMRRRNR
jgi:hypothetical protein